MKTLSFLFFFVLVTSCASFEDPVEFVSYDGSNLEMLNMDEAAFRIQSTVHNNTGLPIKIKPSMLEVYVDGKKWGDLYLDEKIRLKPKKDNELNTLSIDLKKVPNCNCGEKSKQEFCLSPLKYR